MNKLKFTDAEFKKLRTFIDLVLPAGSKIESNFKPLLPNDERNYPYPVTVAELVVESYCVSGQSMGFVVNQLVDIAYLNPWRTPYIGRFRISGLPEVSGDSLWTKKIEKAAAKAYLKLSPARKQWLDECSIDVRPVPSYTKLRAHE